MKGAELAKFRNNLHMTQEEFSERLEISRPHLANIESKDSIVPRNLLFKINTLFKTNQTTKSKHPIRYYDVNVTSSPMDIFEDNPSLPSITLDLPGFAGSQIAINVAGDSMFPLIPNGSMVICKEITDKTIIMYGEIFLIVTKDYRMVKRLKKSNKKGVIIATSDNHNGHDSTTGLTYENIEIPIDKIIHLYLVTGSIKRHSL